MDSIMEKILNQMLHKMALFIFNGAENLLNGIDKIISNHQFFAFSQIFFLVFILFFFVLAIKKAFCFKNGQPYQIKVYLNENKKYIIQMSVVFCICIFPTQILHFTFDYWSSFMNEREVFDQLNESAQTVDRGTLTTTIFILFSSASALCISLIQTAEVFALILILFLSPLVLIVSLFNRSIFVKFTQMLNESIFSPIIQTFLMYIAFKTFLPVFITEGNFAPHIESFIILSMIMLTFKWAKNINKMMFYTEKKTKNSSE